MEDNNAKNSLDAFQSIHNVILTEYKKLLSFVDIFKSTLNRESLGLPYHINIIDELHINENGHSRVLLKLLQFRNAKGEYEILQSLLEYIRQHTHSTAFSDIEIKHPLLTQEEERIDLWLRDSSTGYAIIFENKVYDAQDQEEQLSRYIDKTIAKGFNQQKIFVVYLPSDGHDPTDQSWGGYKEEFASRYINLSFREDVLNWLKVDVLPNIRQKDVYLHSAVLQYIDYLEGYFLLREINNKMNMNLDNLIKTQFELDKFDNPQDRIKSLQEKIDDMQDLINSMNALRDRLRQPVIEDWRDKTRNLFPNLNPCKRGELTDVTLTTTDGKDICVFISNERDQKLYCQVEYSRDIPQEERVIAGSDIVSLKDILPDSNNHCVWKYITRHEYDEVFNLFVKVVNRCLNFNSVQ